MATSQVKINLPKITAAEKKESQQIEILRETITDLRRRYDAIYVMYSGIRSQTITFIGAGFTLLGYLYYPTNTSCSNFQIEKNFEILINRLFIPEEIYGKILYALAIFLIFTAMIRLLLSVRGFRWEFSCHEEKFDDIENKETNLSFLQYMRNSYLRVTKLNLSVYEIRHKIVNESLLMLSVGGILMILIKIFN